MVYPTVSIVTITYNHQEYILDTLKSILAQEYLGEIEVIISDDKSPDLTEEKVAKYLYDVEVPENFSIKYFKHSINKGVMNNFLWALNQATGKYIALCEGDDYWIDPLKLQKQVDFMEENEEYSLCFHLVNFLNNETKETLSIYPSNLTKTSFTQEDIAEGNFIATLSILFRKPKETFPVYTNINVGDYPLYLFLSSNGPFKFLDFLGGTYRTGVGIYSTLERRSQQIDTKKMLKAVLKKDFLSNESREKIIKQNKYFGNEIFKTDKRSRKYFELILGKCEYEYFSINERIRVLLKSLI